MTAQKKTQLEVHAEIDTLVAGGPPVNTAADWYVALCEEIDAIRVETTFIATETLLNGKLAIGEALHKYRKHGNITQLVQQVGQTIKVSDRELWYCYKFHLENEKLRELPAFHSKALSWNKVKKMLADPNKAKLPCTHKHTTTITICVDCGGKVDDKG